MSEGQPRAPGIGVDESLLKLSSSGALVVVVVGDHCCRKWSSITLPERDVIGLRTGTEQLRDDRLASSEPNTSKALCLPSQSTLHRIEAAEVFQLVRW